MKKLFKIFLIILASTMIYGCVNFFTLSDLRKEGYTYPNNLQKAKTLIGEMGQAHAIHMWDSIDTYSVIFEDEFYGFIGKRAHPFKEQKMTFSLSYIPTTTDGLLEIITGKEKNSKWGIQSWQTYQKLNSKKQVPKNNKDMKFWIPTYQYFIEFARRIQEATVIDYIGSQTINGRKSEGIIASWNTVSPQKNIDQYLIWIDAETKRIVKIEYTVRDFYRFITGAASFNDYKNFNGIILPTSMPVESNLVRKGLLHEMRILNFSSDSMTVADLRPLE